MRPYHLSMAEIRRVLLVQPLAGTRWRSINAYASSLASLLESAGIEVDLAAAPWFNPPSLVKGAWGRWTRQPELARAQDGAYDVIHITDQALAHHVSRFVRWSPVVVTCHDLMPFTTPGYYRTRGEGAVKRAFLRHPTNSLRKASVVAAVSEFTGREIVSRLGSEMADVLVVPHVLRGVFTETSPTDAEASLSAAGIHLPPRLRVLSVGNDRAYKNLPALFEAMAHPSLAHASLVRVGVPLRGRDRRAARAAGVLWRTLELGYLSDEHLALVYGACDVLAQPSLAEGFGVPVIEAMACGLPAIISDGGSLPEVAGEAAVVVPLSGAGFPARFALGMGAAVSQAPQLRLEGLARVARFRPEAVLPALLDAYAAAIRRKGVEA